MSKKSWIIVAIAAVIAIVGIVGFVSKNSDLSKVKADAEAAAAAAATELETVKAAAAAAAEAAAAELATVKAELEAAKAEAPAEEEAAEEPAAEEEAVEEPAAEEEAVEEPAEEIVAEEPAEEEIVAEEPAEEEIAAEEPAEEPAEEIALVEVIDFEDEQFAFAAVEKLVGNAGDAELSIGEFNGSKALKITVPAKVPYVTIGLDALAGDRVADVRTISMDIAIENAEDGKFYAVSGNLLVYYGEDAECEKTGWSVYMAKKNPYSVKATLSDDYAFVAGANNRVTVSKETDNYVSKKGGTPIVMYIDNIRLLDADGNVIPMNAAGVYEAPAATGKDTSNLFAISNAVEFEGFSVSGSAWSQNGLEMPQEIIDALVPGSIVEIEFESTSGDMWLVMPWAQAGWMRVGGCGNGTDYVNNSKSIAQVPYELIAQFCGEDKSTWGAMMQCESSGDWSVYAVRVGTASANFVFNASVEFEGFATSGSAWGQNGFEMPQEIIDALVPGTYVEIEFESTSGDMWLVMPWAQAGWMRVGGCGNGQDIVSGNKAYVSYELIAQFCGEDKTTWGAMMQCESSGDWSVYAVKVGTMTEIPALKDFVEFPGFSTSAGAWSQDGLEMPAEVLAALVPGAVVDVEFESENGDLWIVMPDSAAGWMRVGGCGNGQDVVSGSHAYITYELIEQFCGSDVSTWGARMQAEASGAWTVYSVRIGQR